MNKTSHRIIFSQSQQQFIVVSELAKSKTPSERRSAVGKSVRFSDGVSIGGDLIIASVQEQSGIFAGDDGYQVAVKGHTELSGGLITSTAQAESKGKNRFRTGTIDSRDIENHANYKGSTLGVSGGFSVGGGESAKEVGGVKLAPQGQNYAQQEGDPNSGQGK
ncbi:ESPR domain-containing protein [Testudinibacter sp. P80/BLE/0925]|uniref:ESPR domain-containing protein n=1 Tax=Testudinibacter sp. TW-1 TaxID=3417757 RepID=UPI003D35A8DA